MLTWFDIHRTEDIVHASQFSRLTIDSSRPTGIVDLREHQHTTLTTVHIIGQTVGLIAGNRHHTGRILHDSLAQLSLKLLVGHSLVAQVEFTYCYQLLVGIADVVEFVYHPGIAIGIGVLNGNGLSALQREDEVLRVEHV